jgi:hypothetical protein
MSIDWLIIVALAAFLLAFLLVYLVWREDRRTLQNDARAPVERGKARKRSIDYI